MRHRERSIVIVAPRLGGVLGGLLAVAAVLGTPSAASAFCRTFSCDPSKTTCPLDPKNKDCIIGGKPLYWPVSCVGFALNQDAAKSQGISYEKFEQVAITAFATWQNVQCSGNAHPSLQFSNLGPAACDRHEYNDEGKAADGSPTTPAQGNANLIVFRETKWPYAGTSNTLALTTLTFNVDTGEIYDADMEINAVKSDNALTVGDKDVKIDLLSVVTHEAGHFIGVAHSPDADATMNAHYESGSTGLRDLSADDRAAICSIYPPNRQGLPACDATPRHGYASDCSVQLEDSSTCSATPGRAAPAGTSAAALLAIAGSVALRRRRR
jgi:MYXO-CTERM domain-containing protein